jgi:hypothetical protein
MGLFFTWVFFDGKGIGTHTIVATWHFLNAKTEVNGVYQNFREWNVARYCVLKFGHNGT